MRLEDREGAFQLVAALERARVVEGDDEVSLGGRVQSLLDRLPRGKQVGEGDTAEIMADHRARLCGGGLEGRDAGDHVHRDARGLEVDDLVDQGRHGIDAGIAGTDEGDLLALFRQFDRVAHAILLATQGKAVLLLVRLHVRNEVEIEAVSNPVGRGFKGSMGRRCAPVGRARTDADHMHDAARAAWQGEQRLR